MKIDFEKFEPERILVIQLRQIGDVLLTTPALAGLRERYPQARISYLTEQKPALVLQGNPDIDEIIIRPADGFLTQIELMERIRKSKFDLVVDYLANPRCVMIALWSRAKVTISYRTHRRWMFYNTPVVPIHGFSAMEKLSLLRVLGCSQEYRELKMPLPAAAIDFAERFFLENNLRDGKLVVCMELFHKRPVRQWPGRHFAALADLLKRHYGGHVIMMWGPGMKDAAHAVLSQAQENHLLAPATDLHQMAALYRSSDIYVGNDCGPRHIAASQGKPTFVILGPTGDDWTPPDPDHITVSQDIDCRPCNLRYCPLHHHGCMEFLTPDEVFAKLQKFIADRSITPHPPRPKTD